MPEIEYAFLADAAEVQPGQKFHVLGGGVSRVTGSTLPFVHPHLSLVVGLRVTAVERNREHEIGFIFTAPDGSQVTSASGKVIAHGPSEAADVVVTLAIDLWNLTLQSLGEHLVRIMVDGSERKRLGLTVAQAQTPAPATEQRYLA
jgi:hypothetical protein